MAGIPLDWLINVTSTGVRDKFSLSKLPTLLITKYNNDLPNPRFSQFYNENEVKKVFGNASNPALFASNYFGFTSKKASKADLLNVLNANFEATKPSIKGGTLGSVESLKFSGTFTLTLENTTRTISADLSNAISFYDVAQNLTNAIQSKAETQTTLKVIEKENAELTISTQTQNAHTQVLDIVTNSNYVVENSDDTIATFDNDTKTITAIAQGESVLTFKTTSADLSNVCIKISLQVVENDGEFVVNSTFENLVKIDSKLEITTNANDYAFEIAPENAINFTKDTSTITIVGNGNAVLTFKAKKDDLKEATLKINVAIAENSIINLEIGSEVKSDLKEAFKNAEVVFNTHTQCFILKSGIAGADSQIDFIKKADSGIDLSQALKLDKDNAEIVKGENALIDINEILNLVNVENGAYYVLQFDFELSDDEALDFAKFVNNSNDRFLGIINSQNSKLITNQNENQLKAYNGILVEYSKDRSILGTSSGIISALDFSQQNGNANIAFNDMTKFENIAILKDSELNNLEANLANSILKFQQLGQSQVWYGMGNICGDKTNSANIYVSNSYLKFSLQFSFGNMFASQSMIGLRGSGNNGLIMSYAESVFSSAVNSGIIVEGAELTNTEKNNLLTSFSNGESAIKQCETLGYYYEIANVDLVNSRLAIACAYVANKPIKQLVINNYILGA